MPPASSWSSRSSAPSSASDVSSCLLGLAPRLDHLVDPALEEERALGHVVVLALEDLLEPADGLGDRDVLARRAGEGLGHEERLREEALDPARALHGQLVLVGELVDAEDGDDVLQLLVALQHLLDLVGHAEVLLADDVGLEDRRGRVQRVDRGIDALLGDRPGQRRRRVEVREHRRRRRVGEVVGGDVDGLHRGDRALARGGDPLLELAHLGLQRGLVADLRGHAPEQRRDLRAGLDEAEDVVDEQEHVLAALLAEVLGHGQARQGHAHARARAARSSGRTRASVFVEDARTPSSRATGRCPRGSARPRRRTPTGRSCSSAMLRISSWMSTVLPTPAPPNRPTLPPLA